MARFRRACIGLLVGAAALSAMPAEGQILIGGRITTPTVLLGREYSPKVSLYIRGDTKSVGLIWSDPNGAGFQQNFNPPRPSGATLFEGVRGISNALAPYAAAGTWTLAAVGLCADSCTSYTGSALASLFPSLTFTVVNPKADIVAPSVTQGAILTPTVRASRRSIFQAALTMSDDHSGVVSAEIEFGTAPGFSVGGLLTHPVIAPETYKFLTITDEIRLPAGVYPVTSVTVSDAAGNRTTISDPSAISTLFNGQQNITITN